LDRAGQGPVGKKNQPDHYAGQVPVPLAIPYAAFLTVAEIMHKAGVADKNKREIIDLVGVLEENNIIEITAAEALS